MTKGGETNLCAMGARSLEVRGPCKVVQVVAGKSRAIIWSSTAILRACWSCTSAPEGFHAGLDCHLGSFSGAPRDIADAQNFVWEALANFWNLFILPVQKIWLHFGALHGGWAGWGFQNMVAAILAESMRHWAV